jgi:hypothetical protein
MGKERDDYSDGLGIGIINHDHFLSKSRGSPALEKTFESLIVAWRDWDYNLDHHFACCLQFDL